MKKIRLLFVYRRLVPPEAASRTLYAGGAQKRVLQMARHFAGLDNYEVFVASNDAPDALVVRQLQEWHVTHVRINFDRTSCIGIETLRLWNFIRREKIMIANANDRKSAFMTFLATRFSRCRFVVTIRSNFADLKLSRLWFGKNVVAVSNGVKQHLENFFHCPARYVTTIHNGIDFKPAKPEAVEQVRHQWEIAPETMTIVGAGRLDPVKGYDVLIRALPKILERCPTVRVLLVGAGSEEQKLRDLARELKVADHLTLCGQQDEVAPYYGLADLVAVPSFIEGLAGVPIESALCCRTVVASNIPGIDEIVRDGQTGLLFPAGDSEQLAEKVITLLEDAALRQKMACEAERQARERFSLSTMLSGYERYFSNLIP